MDIGHILIASDLSDRSDRAVARGIMIAEMLGASATIVTIVDDNLPEDIAAQMAERAREHLAYVASQAKGAAPHILVETGDALDRLIALANDPATGLVVAGRHRPRGLMDRLRPTTVERLASESLKPVLLVTSPVHGPYETALASVAFSRACRRAVKAAKMIAPAAEMQMIHAWLAPFEGLTGGETSGMAHAVEAETRALAAEWSASLPEGLPEVELVHGAVVDVLHRRVRETKPDLLAVGAHTRSLSFTGLGAFAADLVRDPPTDILVAGGSASA
ncbi:universal stress protein [Rhodobacterales bacterium HKCCE3408]|nr:universal stress protein [Rhodobacterales bacterium HKCCE3408]